MPVSTPTVSRLFLHPIKSLERLSVTEARLLSGGSFAHDREFALFDQDGNFVNGKRQSRVHLLRAEYDLANFTVTLGAGGVQNCELGVACSEQSQQLEAEGLGKQ